MSCHDFFFLYSIKANSICDNWLTFFFNLYADIFLIILGSVCVILIVSSVLAFCMYKKKHGQINKQGQKIAIIQSAGHVTAVRCIKSAGCRSRASANAHITSLCKLYRLLCILKDQEVRKCLHQLILCQRLTCHGPSNKVVVKFFLHCDASC